MLNKTSICFALAASLAAAAICGCDDNNRVPTKAEIQTANAKDQSYVDSIPNLTPEQRATMKSHMGGPPAPPMNGQQAKGPRGGS
jgi:hypothetical protein